MHYVKLVNFKCAFLLCVFALFLAATGALAVESDALSSEQDYFREIPQVFAVSRLPQKPQDTSGANTLIEREYIQASGARTLSDLFVGIPGFQVGYSAGGRPVVAYHGFSGEISQRMQVFVDGRSLYAPYMFGGVDWSSVSVPLDEIERIEIHRGSNSAAFGANAFLSVIQIYTRAAVQATGASAHIRQGNNGIADRSVRFGRSSDDVQWRVVASQQGDQGLINRSDNFKTESVDFKAEYQKSITQSLILIGGANKGRFGEGVQNSIADPIRDDNKSSTFAHLKFKELVDDGQEWSLSSSLTQDKGYDTYQVPILSGGAVNIAKTRQANRFSLEYQHFRSLSQDLRASWGAEFHLDEVQSFDLFSTDATQKNSAWRIYFNQEWTPLNSLTFNAGGLFEKDLFSPQQFAPRFSANWKPSSNQVFKLGYSSAFRTPSLFEQKSDWRVRDENNQTLYIKYLSRGGLVPEHIRARDLVYQAQWAPLGLSLDVRLFKEELSSLITRELYQLSGGTNGSTVAYDLRNSASASQHGSEYQLSWRPFSGSTIYLSEYRANTGSIDTSLQLSAPQSSSSLAWMHRAENGFSLFTSYARTVSMTWLGESTAADEQKLISMSLQKAFKLDLASLRTSLTWRRPIGHFVEYRELQYMPRTVWLGVQIDH